MTNCTKCGTPTKNSEHREKYGVGSDCIECELGVTEKEFWEDDYIAFKAMHDCGFRVINIDSFVLVQFS